MAILQKKCRICRRERKKLFLKGGRCFSPKCPIERKGAVPPGIHGVKSGVRLSSFGIQLREKQKTKRYYGIGEEQLKNYLREAAKAKGRTDDNLMSLLERRLDNVIYRLGLAPSRRSARQLTVHGLVKVNGKKVTFPAFKIKTGDIIELLSKALKIKYIEEWLGRKEGEIPDWLKREGPVGKAVGLPEEKHFPTDLDVRLVIEFYSR